MKHPHTRELFELLAEREYLGISLVWRVPQAYDHFAHGHAGPCRFRLYHYLTFSHNSTDVDNGLLAQMSKQVRLRRDEFDNLVECTLAAPQYPAILIAKQQVTISQQHPHVTWSSRGFGGQRGG
jgi:hypothetical protein